MHIYMYENFKIFKTLLPDICYLFRQSFRKSSGNLPAPERGNHHVGNKTCCEPCCGPCCGPCWATSGAAKPAPGQPGAENDSL